MLIDLNHRDDGYAEIVVDPSYLAIQESARIFSIKMPSRAKASAFRFKWHLSRPEGHVSDKATEP
jgi:hypothetical protein